MINLNRFDLVSLRLFVAVVDAGSLTAGADRFGISLAAASKRIAELEQHCGTPLLQRGQRGVTATADGQTLHRHAIEVIARLEQLAQAVDDFHSGATGHLRLCANPSAFGGFLPGVLAEYAVRFPKVTIDLDDALSEQGIRAVQKGLAELAVIGDNVPCEGLETIVCNVDHLVLLAPVLLLALRVLQGVAVGGEVPGAWVFVAEHVPPARVGFACASLTAGLTVGILIGSLATAAINQRLDHAALMAWGWRLPFLVGGVFGFVAVWLRRWLRETPVFEAMQAHRTLADELPLKRVLRTHRGAVTASMAVTWTLTAAIVVVILMTPTLVQAVFHLPPATAFLGSSVASFALALGCLAFGALVDRFGTVRTLAFGAVALVVTTYVLYLDLRHGAGHFLPLYALAGFAVGVVGVVPTVMVNAFPPAVRFTGLSFSYNVAYAVFGGITPPLIGAMVKATGPLAPAHYVAIAALAALVVAAALRGNVGVRRG